MSSTLPLSTAPLRQRRQLGALQIAGLTLLTLAAFALLVVVQIPAARGAACKAAGFAAPPPSPFSVVAAAAQPSR